MNPIIGLTVLSVNVLCFVFNKKTGIFLYLVLSFVLPIVNIFNNKISYEILFFPFLIFFFIITNEIIYINKQAKYLLLYFFVYIISTIVSNIFNDAVNLYIHIFGFMRLIIIYVVLINQENFKFWFKDLLVAVLTVNLVIMSVQFLFPNSISIFYNLYAKDSALALAGMLNLGYFTRLSGTFNNIVPASFFFVLTTTTFLVEYSRENSFKNIMILCSAVLCGLATSSKSFIIAMPIIFVINLIIKKVYEKSSLVVIKQSKIKFMNLFLVFALTMTILLFLYYSENILETNRYINDLSIDNIFSSRYSQDKGITIEALNVFKNNYLLGVGATSLIGEFLGDSFYVVVLHNTGIIGMLIILLFLLNLILSCMIEKNRQNILLIVSIIIVGFAGNTIFSLSGVCVLAYITTNISIYDNSHFILRLT